MLWQPWSLDQHHREHTTEAIIREAHSSLQPPPSSGPSPDGVTHLSQMVVKQVAGKEHHPWLIPSAITTPIYCVDLSLSIINVVVAPALVVLIMIARHPSAKIFRKL